MKRLEGKVAVITGGNSGMGLATAKLFAAEGAKVVITGRRADAVATAAAELGLGVTGIVADSGDIAAMDKMIDEVRELHGRIDVLFINAAISVFEQLGSIDEKTYDEVFAVNTKGPFFTVQSALPILSDGASIILTASVAHSVGLRGSPVYSASKSALRSFGRTLAGALGPRKIRVNTITPGSIRTSMFQKFGMTEEQIEGMFAEFSKQVPLGRPGEADEIAQTALFLASDASSYITGADIPVEGGATQIIL